MKDKIAVIVGRFQSEAVCDTMDGFIRELLSNGNHVLILLGLAAIQATKQNPLDFETRKLMLTEKYGNEVTIGYVKDGRCDVAWSKDVEDQVEKFAKKNKIFMIGGEAKDSPVTIYGGEHTFIRQFESDKFATEALPNEIYINEEANGNKVSSKVKATTEYRQGVMSAIKSQYPKVYPTVDIAVFDGNKLLLARKPAETLFRFIGGFVDPREKFSTAAVREVKEESNVDLINVEYVDSFVVDDWRYARETDSVTTTLFVADYDGGIPMAQDDIAELKWIDMNEACVGNGRPNYGVLRDQLVEEHADLADAVVDIYENRKLGDRAK